jgi:hypothetical protein
MLGNISVTEANWHYWWDPQPGYYVRDETEIIYDGFKFDFLKKLLFILKLYKLDKIALIPHKHL